MQSLFFPKIFSKEKKLPLMAKSYKEVTIYHKFSLVHLCEDTYVSTDGYKTKENLGLLPEINTLLDNEWLSCIYPDIYVDN